MGFIEAGTGTFTTTGIQQSFIQLSEKPTKFYTGMVATDGGTSMASGFVGYADDNEQWASAYGRSGSNFLMKNKTDKCIVVFKMKPNGTTATYVAAEFLGFDYSLEASGFYILNFNVFKADPSYSHILRFYT